MYVRIATIAVAGADSKHYKFCLNVVVMLD